MLQGNARVDFPNQTNVSGNYTAYFLKVGLSSAFSVATGSGAFTAIQWSGPLDARDDPFHVWVSGSPTQLPPPTPGKYIAMVHVNFQANITGMRRMQIIANGIAVEEWHEANTNAGEATPLFGWWAGEINTGQSLVVNVLQDSGGPLNVLADSWAAIWCPKGYNFIG